VQHIGDDVPDDTVDNAERIHVARRHIPHGKASQGLDGGSLVKDTDQKLMLCGSFYINVPVGLLTAGYGAGGAR